MNAYCQIRVVEIRAGFEILKRIAVEINHTQIRIFGERSVEMEDIPVMGFFIHRRNFQDDRILLMEDFYFLSVHLELCTNLRQSLTIIGQINGVIIVTRIEGEVWIERPLKVLEVLAVQGDICQFLIIRLILKIDHHFIIGGISTTVLRLYMDCITDLVNHRIRPMYRLVDGIQTRRRGYVLETIV